jgi:diguanylate cyclase (GGDEF)-like protein/PAS domain S-box-containing protein
MDAVPVRRQDLRSVFDFAPIGIAILTPDGEITACNPALADLLGRTPLDLVGTTLFAVTHDDDLPLARENCRLMRDGRQRIARHECRLVRRDGSAAWVSVSTARVPAAPGRGAHLIMHVEDVGERKALEARLAHLATHDPLTGLANRALLDERIALALAPGSGAGEVCLLYLDLNGFKQVNDRHGHLVGDAVLVELARRIDGLVGPGDTAARLGGDEFAVLCVGGPAGRPDELAAGLRAAAAEPFRVGGRSIALSAAVGASRAAEHRDGEVPVLRERLLAAADRRMYEVKRAAGS